MIPKRAFFLWCGDAEMPWLRQLSVQTFRKQNPSWVVSVINISRDDGMSSVQSTDVYRYKELAEHGGVYFDTDIIFLKPFPDEMLAYDVGITIESDLPRFRNIACMMASSGNPFFEKCHKGAMARWQEASNDKRRSYQLLGVNMLNRLFPTQKTVSDLAESFPELQFFGIPQEFVNPVHWLEIFRLYNRDYRKIPDNCIGVHWYGGDEQSVRYAKKVDEMNYLYHPCFLSSVISRALKDLYTDATDTPVVHSASIA